MTVRSFSAESDVNTSVVTTTETVVLPLPAVSTTGTQDNVTIFGTVTMTYGTGATAVTLRVRRGTGITGALVGEANAIGVTAAATGVTEVQALDVPGDVAGQPYVITVQQTAATGNGSVLVASGSVLLAP